MKRLCFILSISVAFFTNSIVSVAQSKSNFVVKAGANINYFDANFKQRSNLGYHLGGLFSFNLNSFRIQSGLIYIKRGTRTLLQEVMYTVENHEIIDERIVHEDYDSRMVVNYIEIPLNLSLKVVGFRNNNNEVRLHVEPALGVYISDQIKRGNDKRVFLLNHEEPNYYEELNIGIKFGASFKVGQFEPYAGYDIGINDIAANHYEIRNRSVYLGLGYYIH
ncbi:PorT family protein [Halosquirtibacter xylanolyticus]|uniref:hypothetical protein n=1 Tax=Halosquirtibacter xylanolyticus TaxID=3374599 RepID=UPI0037499511|nr:PorT family protein [Prolixibacteraceae bacterium]